MIDDDDACEDTFSVFLLGLSGIQDQDWKEGNAALHKHKNDYAYILADLTFLSLDNRR